jgi:hypothetical protein
MKRIKLSQIWEIMEQKKENGAPAPFSISYVKKKTGEIQHLPHCICTSIHSKGSTVNIMEEGKEYPKTIRKILIVKFNGMNVYY